MPTLLPKDKDYTKPHAWDIIWNRPYENYKKHHQVFWELIRKTSYGKILDLACGPACYWDKNIDLYGCDFSSSAISEAIKNNPNGKFSVCKLPNNNYNGMDFDTVVVSGLVNYYHDLRPLMEMIMDSVKKGGTVIITVNVIDDFPNRHWDIDTIYKIFGEYGLIDARFFDKIGWFIVITT